MTAIEDGEYKGEDCTSCNSKFIDPVVRDGEKIHQMYDNIGL